MEVVNLADLVRDQIAAQRDIAIACSLPDEALVRGDERLLGRVTANLLDNAVKHGRGATIAIRATHSDGRLALEITNAGSLPADERNGCSSPSIAETGPSRRSPGSVSASLSRGPRRGRTAVTSPSAARARARLPSS